MKIYVYLSNNTELLTKHFYALNNNRLDKTRYVSFPELYYSHSCREHLPRTQREQSELIVKYLDSSNINETLIIATHSETILYALRCAIKTNKINHTDLEIRWINNDDQITSIFPQKNGSLSTWPGSMFTEHDRMLEVLLGPPIS